MKLFTSLLALSISSLALSQTIEIKENQEQFSTGPHNALVTTVYGNKPVDVMKAWKKRLKEYKNESIKSSKNELVADNVLINVWGTVPVDFYTVFEGNKKDKVVKMAVAVNLGDAYLTSVLDKIKYGDLEKMMKDFAIENTKKPIKEELEMHNKAFAKIQKKQIKCEKYKRELEEDVENYKGKISRAEIEIVPKETEIEKKKGEIDAQKRVIEASSGAVPEQIASSRKIYDNLLKEQNSIEKDVKNLREDISDYKGKIARKEKKIKETAEELAEFSKLSEDTKYKVERTKERLNAVN